jgi:hypothetical protein
VRALETLKRPLQRTDVTPSNTFGERFSTAYAFVALMLVDLVIKAAGFNRFYRMVRGFPVLGTKDGAWAGTSKVCSAVDRAASLYFKKAWCLQRSATTACLLRLSGVNAQLVIAARRMPFDAHAWVEMNGRVLNDSPVVQKQFFVLERC